MKRTVTPMDRSFPYWALPFVLAALATRRFSVAIAPLVAFAVLVVADTLATRTMARRTRLRVLGPAAHEATAKIGDPIEFAPTYPHLDRRIDLESFDVPPHTPTRSGVIVGVEIDVRVTAMGLVDRVRRIDAKLERPLLVAPDVIRPDATIESTPADLSTSRRYEWGDRPSRINWAATARTGDLMVRSVGTERDAMTIVVDLSQLDRPDDARSRDDCLGRSAGLAIDALERGCEVVLITNELSDDEIAAMAGSGAAAIGAGSGPAAGRIVERSVGDPADVLVRLARSVPGRPIDVDDDAFAMPAREPSGDFA